MNITMALAVAAAAGMMALAQQPPPGGPGGPGGPRQMQPYDASKEETFKGKVTEVKETARGPMTIVSLVVKIGDADFEIPAGTPDFLKGKNVAFAKDDEISIKGVKTETPRGLRIRAREITRGKDTLTLLDKEGRPAWMPPPA